MWYGWTGTELEVDLSRGKVKKSQGDQEMYRKYLGGHSLITRLFWEKAPPDADVKPFSPDNLLIFGAGPLVGTAAPASCRTTVVTRSAITNLLSSSNMAGFWAPELKFAGYDTLIVSGKSASPVYIYINNDKVEIRDASHLWGKDVFQTQRLIREELKDDKIQSLCIGPAGENRVYYADIGHGPGCSMSRSGSGAIMGDKKLKAIAVRGNKNVNIARPAPFLKLCDDIMDRSAFYDTVLSHRCPDPNSGTLYLNTLLPTSGSRLHRNFEFMKPWKEIFQKYLDFLVERKAVMIGCFNCQQQCIHAVHLNDGETIYWKCHSRHCFTHAGDVQDFDYSLRCFSLVQKYGMDTDSAQNLCRFAIDLFQKGILTEKDTGGLVLEWGNPEVIPALMEKIAYRRDIGDILANGAYHAAQQIGRGAEQYTHHLRKLELGGGAHKVSTAVGAIRLLINDRLFGKVDGFGSGSYDGLLTVEELNDPEEVKRWKKALPSRGADMETGAETIAEIDPEILGKATAYINEICTVRDSGGLCYHRFSKDDNLHEINVAFIAEMVSHATGIDFSKEEARKCVRRAKALIRAYNAILGERMRASDLLPQDAQWLPQNILANDRAFLSKLIADTNEVLGYSAEGIPKQEHLEKLGLSDVARKLENSGILPEAVSIPAA